LRTALTHAGATSAGSDAFMFRKIQAGAEAAPLRRSFRVVETTAGLKK
jgi:hypothetical protein